MVDSESEAEEVAPVVEKKSKAASKEEKAPSKQAAPVSAKPTGDKKA